MAGQSSDPSEWKPACELLQSNGYQVTIIEKKPLTLEERFRATILALECNEGAAVFVGHSWNKDNLAIYGGSSEI